MVKIQFALLLLEQFAISQGLIEPFLKKIKIVYVVHTCTLSCQLINMKMRFFFQFTLQSLFIINKMSFQRIISVPFCR